MKDKKAEDTNGWTEIGDKLHGIDDERIDRCNNDMDSLLVFVRAPLAFRFAVLKIGMIGRPFLRSDDGVHH